MLQFVKLLLDASSPSSPPPKHSATLSPAAKQGKVSASVKASQTPLSSVVGNFSVGLVNTTGNTLLMLIGNTRFRRDI